MQEIQGDIMKYKSPKDSQYYDLVRIPHGHIPAPMIRLWKHLPIPVKGVRDSNTFHCRGCGFPSFFKTNSCYYCQYWDSNDPDYWEWAEDQIRLERSERWRARWKQLEYLFLPLLVVFGKAWYMPSRRRHVNDWLNDGGRENV